jgi:signal transduction histidine kinase
MLSGWRSRRQPDGPDEPVPPAAAFELLEEAPIVALLLDESRRVVAANAHARRYFDIRESQLPASLVEATREARLVEAASSAETVEVRLTHHQRTVLTSATAGPQPGQTLLFLTDVSELRRLETVRQEFVANLSHELKTPLTSLRLAAESLLEDVPADARKTFAARVVSEADNLVEMIDNLRHLAEIEAGADKPRREPVDIASLINEVAGRLALDHPVQLDVPAGLQIESDRSRLAQALSNLLDNAAKFSPPGAPIEVTARTETGEVVVTIRDHGPGISPEHWERIFERFYKVDPARTRGLPGSGLGLAIAKHLALSLGGRLWTEAASDGGQVFGLALPVNPAITGG